MTLADYLSLLYWQGCSLTLRDFILLETKGAQNPENFADIVSLSKTREYLIHNKYWWKKAETDYKHCRSKNYQLLYPGQALYPKKFCRFFEEAIPIFLSLGDLPGEGAYLPVTFVGSRTGDEQTFNWMDFYLPQLLKEKNICIVSGGARGIDQKAHKIAIRSGVPTLCFLPSGMDHFYPNSLRLLKKGILDSGGAFLSCFPPDVGMQKSYFHIRNSFMAAYSSLVVILQAQIRSGTMLTARKSIEYGIPLAVLPGPVLSARWTGNLQLIYDGAYLIRDNIDLSCLIESLTVRRSEDQFKASEEYDFPETPMSHKN